MRRIGAKIGEIMGLPAEAMVGRRQTKKQMQLRLRDYLR